MCVKNDKVTKHYSEPFKLKIFAEFSTKKYVKNQLIKGRTIYTLAINVWVKKCELMADNKTRRYVKYAVGEIVHVMIGILIALQGFFRKSSRLIYLG
jgi:hypothetical protein